MAFPEDGDRDWGESSVKEMCLVHKLEDLNLKCQHSYKYWMWEHLSVISTLGMGHGCGDRLLWHPWSFLNKWTLASVSTNEQVSKQAGKQRSQSWTLATTWTHSHQQAYTREGMMEHANTFSPYLMCRKSSIWGNAGSRVCLPLCSPVPCPSFSSYCLFCRNQLPLAQGWENRLILSHSLCSHSPNSRTKQISQYDPSVQAPLGIEKNQQKECVST